MPVLSYRTGALFGQEFKIGQAPVIIGRGQGADLVLDDSMASTLHAKIVAENGGWRLDDLDSSNGTEINGILISSQLLTDRDVVMIGDTQFMFLLGSADAVTAPGPIPTPPAPIACADDLAIVEQMSHRADLIRKEIGKTIVGQLEVIDQVLMCILASGHALLIGLPGMAKTLLVSTLATVLDLHFKRVQFTPDLMPSDIIGTDVLETNRDTGEKEFRFIRGPIFCNLLLADEINRTPPKTQAALLEAMQEKRVTAGNETFTLDAPFFVLATQNPIEQEGTYPLPEAQLDRFMFNIWVDYPEQHEEEAIVSATTMGQREEPQAVLTKQDLLQLQEVVRKVPVSEHVIKYAIRLVRATRPSNADAPEVTKTYVSTGAGPRAGQYLVLAAKAMAVLDGRIHVGCSDIRRAAPPVLRHRLLTNFAADSEGLASIDIVNRILEAVQEPGAEAYAARG